MCGDIPFKPLIDKHLSSTHLDQDEEAFVDTVMS